MLSLSNAIREFAYNQFIGPVKDQALKTVTLRAGDIHDVMGLKNRMRAVCGAIRTKWSETKYQIRGIRRDGPTNGANALFTYGIE